MLRLMSVPKPSSRSGKSCRHSRFSGSHPARSSMFMVSDVLNQLCWPWGIFLPSRSAKASAGSHSRE